LGGYSVVLKLGKGRYGKTRLCSTPDGFHFAIKIIELLPGKSKQVMIKDMKHIYSLKHMGITQINDIVDLS